MQEVSLRALGSHAFCRHVGVFVVARRRKKKITISPTSRVATRYLV